MNKDKMSTKSILKFFSIRLLSIILFAVSILIFFSISFLSERFVAVSSFLFSLAICSSFIVLLISICRRSKSQFNFAMKRIFDILVSLTCILFFFPAFSIITLIIFFDTGWPIFSMQKYIGLNQRHFDRFNFRTTRQEVKKDLIKNEFHNEIYTDIDILSSVPATKIGIILRKSSLDQLPLFFNVLIGDMSLVGPTPLAVKHFNRFYEDQSWLRRFNFKPGITGFGQVSGKNDISFEQLMNLDLKYVDNWNFVLDLKILLKTIPAVLWHVEPYEE